MSEYESSKELLDKYGLDPDDIEDTLVFESSGAVKGGNDGSPEDRYFPDSDDYQSKTIVTQKQKHVLIQMRIMPEVFDGQIPDNILDAYEKYAKMHDRYAVSVDGHSRQEFKEILKSMGGVYSEEDESTMDKVRGALKRKAGMND